MNSNTFDTLSDSVFALRGIKVLLTTLANGNNDSDMRNALTLLSNDVAGVEEKIDSVLRRPKKEQ